MKAYDMYEKENILYFKKCLSSVNMVSFSRRNLTSFFKTDKATKPAVYILYNDTVNGVSSIYIGETENIKRRLEEHNKTFGKTFWTGTVVFQSDDNSLNKAHYKYLEHMFFEKASFASRYRIANKLLPTKSSLSPKDEIVAAEFLNEAYELLKTVRLYFFEHYQLSDTNENEDIFYLYHPFGTGKLQVIDDDEVLLLKDSVILFSNEDPHLESKKNFLSSGKIKEIEGTTIGILNESIKFQSDNDAASFVTADPESDWTMWSNINGETTSSLRRFK